MSLAVHLLGWSLATFAVCFAFARTAALVLRTPPAFAPFSVPPILTGSLGGVIGANLVYFSIAAVTLHPWPFMVAMTLAVLALSISLPLRLLRPRPNRSPRFQGANKVVVLALFAMHGIVASGSLGAAHGWLAERGSVPQTP